jgi:hypothetical protein
MRTRIFGEQTDTVVIDHYEGAFETKIKCADSIVKIWLSDGTILGLKYGKDSKLYPNIWNIRVLQQGYAEFKYTQCYNETLLCYSDTFEIEAELNDYEVIPRSRYEGDML